MLHIHNEEAYDNFLIQTFDYLHFRLGEEKLNELINTERIPADLEGLPFGTPMVHKFVHLLIDNTYFGFERDENICKSSSSFISTILNELNPNQILAFNINYDSPLFGYDINKYTGLTTSEQQQNLFKIVDEKSKVDKILYPNDSNEFEKTTRQFYQKFDLVISYPNDLDRKTKKGSDLKRYLIESLKCLNDSGNLLFIAPTNITLNQNFKESLNKEKAYISAIFETNDTSLAEGYNDDGIPWREYMPLSIFLISKNKIDQIFSCQIQEKNIHYNKAVLKNYLTKTKGKIPSMGTFIKLNDFRGNKLLQWLDDKKKQYKGSDIIPKKLIEITNGDISSHKDGRFEEKPNSIFINPNEEGDAKIKMNEDQDNRQVVNDSI